MDKKPFAYKALQDQTNVSKNEVKPMIKKLFFVLVIFSGLVLGSSYPTAEVALAQSGDPVFVGAGDIANCSGNTVESTAKLFDGIPGTVFTVGDNAYPDGTSAQFTDCYGPTWGRHKDRTRPAPGNHDYHTAGASGYFGYFGAAAGDPAKGYYSYNLGAWHIIALNSEITYNVGSAQEQWLRADLAKNQSMCTLAYWHKPLFSSGQHGNNSGSKAFWQALYEYGADVVLNGHDHTYQRFAPQNPSGQADPKGIREFVVGTGGAGLYPFPTTQPNTEVRNNTTFGVLKLTLHATSYDWQFVPIAGQTFTDSGSANCVGSGSGQIPTPTRTSTSAPIATSTMTRTPIATLPTSAVTATQTSLGAATSTSISTELPNTVVPDIGSDPSDKIFADSFESGNLSAWTSDSIDNGDLSVNAAAALTGSQGMQAVIDDANTIYVRDDGPNAEPRYRARFYFDPNSISMTSGNTHFIFKGFMGTTTEVVRIEFRQSSGAYQLRASLLNDSSAWIYTDWFTISDASHFIEFDWRASTGRGANNGGLTLWIDGTQQTDLTGVDNDTRRVDRMRLGALTGIDSGTRGKYYFDAFESRRQSYIGPVGSRPGPIQPPLSTAVGTSIPTATPTLGVALTNIALTPTTSTLVPVATNTPLSAVTSTPVSPSTATPSSGSRIVYTVSNEDFANPERGFMKQSSIFPEQPFDAQKVRALQPSDTLVWIYFRLDNYRTKPLDPNSLNNIRSVFTTARSRGLKLVIRFAYNDGPGSTTDANLANPDAPLELALQHIDQLKPILLENADVIAVMQAGFVGHWGEWHSSKYLHPLEYRKAIVDALLSALPRDRMLQIRYPRYKQIFYQTPLTAQEAFSGSDKSRVAHHNDCFLRDQDDAGTYKSVSAQEPKIISTYCDGKDAISCWKDFVATESQFTPVGGETCQYNPPRTDCPNTLQEMAMLHWSFINNGYRPEVLNGWTSGGCMETIRSSLGYRLVLKEASLPTTIKPGGTLSLNIRLSNVGFAAMYNPRPLYIVLVGGGRRFEAPVTNIDPRRWAPGQEQTINVNLALPATIPAGTYQVGLWLPDASGSLRNSPAYAVRFANTDVWDPATGINILFNNFQVVP